MSTTATIINPMISKQQQQTIKQEILSDFELIKSEDESSVEVALNGPGGVNGSSSNGIGAVAAAAAAAAAASGGKCILYISSSSGGNLTVCKTSTSTPNSSSSSSTTSEESLDVKNGHNYSSNKAAAANNTGNGHHNNNNNNHHNHHPHNSHHQVNTSAGSLQRQQQQQHHLNSTVTTTANSNNSNNRLTGKRIDFAKQQQQQQLHHGSNNNLDLYSAPGSLEQSPSSSPLSFNAESTHQHPQDMFCSSTVGGDGGGLLGQHHLLDTTTGSDHSSSAGGGGVGAKGSGATTAAASSRGDGSPKRLCLVCGDTASGFHYGVASCEACKAFFKRTIQGNIEYTCPATNNCEINKRRRKACQACRFQKCLRMGMLKEGVRLDRVRGGRQKYRRTSEAPYGHVGGGGGGHGGSGANGCGVNGFGLKKTNIDDNRIVAALISCEPEAIVLNSSLMSSPSSSSGGSFASVSSSQYKNLSILSELVDKELVATIGWAKQIPSFSELTLNDQMRLLQSTWAEILALSLAFRSHQYSSPPNTPAGLSPNNASSTTTPIFNKLVFATDYILDDQAATQCNAEAFFSQMIALIGRLHQMKIAKEEYLLMKAIILTNADIPLENYERVAKLRETLVHALQETVSALRPSGAVVGHLSQLFLCLPLLRQLDAVTRSLWLTVLKEGSVPMNKLFIEMLETRVLA